MCTIHCATSNWHECVSPKLYTYTGVVPTQVLKLAYFDLSNYTSLSLLCSS